MSRTAVVLFNLGGPDSLAAVQPFLNNLFNDPAILPLPWPLRPILAQAISNRRRKEACRIYESIGGRSPLLEGTRAQAQALETALGEALAGEARVFVAMRYWHPMSDDTAREVAAFAPDKVVLLPLYPQFSTTTTASSMTAWRKAARRAGLRAQTASLCCWPREAGFVAAHAGLIRAALDRAGERPVRLLFSAHGLPQKVVDGGDPYCWQVEQGAAAIAAAIGRAGIDWRVCYQSRVGPLAWTGPATDEEIARAGADGMGAVVVPIAFVSEHSETLVELDRDLAATARAAGCRPYIRVPALGTHEAFIRCLAGLVERAGEGGRLCPAAFARCPRRPPAGA